MKSIVVICLSLLCTAVMAQKLVGVKVDSAPAVAGQAVKVSVVFDVDDAVYCGIRLNWGDGSGDDFKIEDAQKVPYAASHVYAKAGDYTIAAVPQRVMSRLPCQGKQQNAMVKVSAPAPLAAAPGAAAVPAAVAPKATASACPAGWTLNAKSVNKKTKAFSCTANPGTAAPEKKLTCEGSTGYFENIKKGVIGCQA